MDPPAAAVPARRPADDAFELTSVSPDALPSTWRHINFFSTGLPPHAIVKVESRYEASIAA